MSDDKIVTLHKSPVQHDIVQGLRNLADTLERDGPEAYDMPAITTVCVVLGHTETKLVEDGELAQSNWSELFSWGVRNDVYTVRGLLVTAARGYKD